MLFEHDLHGQYFVDFINLNESSTHFVIVIRYKAINTFQFIQIREQVSLNNYILS